MNFVTKLGNEALFDYSFVILQKIPLSINTKSVKFHHKLFEILSFKKRQIFIICNYRHEKIIVFLFSDLMCENGLVWRLRFS